MALENLLGNVYISDLNSDWPAGTDLPDAGDDHIRGIKNVLKRSFPNITGPVTLTQAQINAAAFPTGTRMLFQQTAAPTGWTKVTDHDDKALRVVSGSVVNGGTVAFSTALGTGGTTGGHAISSAEMPAHTHGATGLSVSLSSHSHAPPSGTSAYLTQATSSPSGYFVQSTSGFAFKSGATSQIPSASVTGSISGSTASTGSGSAHTHSMDLDVSYVDTIIAEKA